ncbi:hypothetical protein HPB52_016760 [Rhipicephalus sanguineus]|uniref:Uncharacterized protein n=1 Tax=Rhipicephalus sanguineus TaxID=34632 RepID=A0A9D4Q7H6_RHISA|nr:hypothetical protein HPB52_016760 [Rhipicephalus sanguineus]
MRACNFNVVPDRASAYYVIPSYANHHVRPSRNMQRMAVFYHPEQARPRTVDDFLNVVSEVDRALDHARLIRSPQSTEQFAGQPVRPQFQSATPRSDSTVNSPQNARPSTFQHATPTRQPPRIASLPPADQESRYEAIAAKYGSPAYRRGQDLRDAVCYNCQKRVTLQVNVLHRSSLLVTTSRQSPKHQQACVGRVNDTLYGSKFRCAVVTAQVKGLGEISAFPDSGSNVTILAASLASNLKIEPWTKPPLLVLVEAAILERNALPLILGEDWFYAAQAELHFKPPKVPVICQPSTKPHGRAASIRVLSRTRMNPCGSQLNKAAPVQLETCTTGPLQTSSSSPTTSLLMTPLNL